MNRNKQIIKLFLSFFILLNILMIVIALSICIGSTKISISKIINVFLSKQVSEYHDIIFNERLSRIILGIAIGGSLSLSGVLLQGVFRNPLVEPYTLGIAGGAALGVSIYLIAKKNFFLRIFSLPISGIIGSFIVILILYLISLKKKFYGTQSILLIGVMISFISSSLLMLIMALSKSHNLQRIIFWMMGSLNESNWKIILISLFISISTLIISFFFWRNLNALSIGDEEAHYIGINVNLTQKIIFIIASILTGLCVSTVGIIGFVGLIIPHFLRLILGNDHRILILTSYLGGAIFLISCDTIARVIILPNELPVGVITGILGGIILIYVLTKKKVNL